MIYQVDNLKKGTYRSLPLSLSVAPNNSVTLCMMFLSNKLFISKLLASSNISLFSIDYKHLKYLCNLFRDLTIKDEGKTKMLPPPPGINPLPGHLVSAHT